MQNELDASSDVQAKISTEQNRNLGDEWQDWDGQDGTNVRAGKGLFLAAAFAVIIAIDVLVALFTYLISPRINSWSHAFPIVAWVLTCVFIFFTSVWFLQILLTVLSSRNFLLFRNRVWILFDIIFNGVFRLASLVGISRDRMGNSFVQIYNEISKALKRRGKRERLLILLPRCLTKDQLKEINALKEVYPLEIHTVSGGELARKKIREIRPTAVIGVACERDLISGIRDVGKKLSLIGIPNTRPEGPCTNTHVDMKKLIEAIEFYVGPPKR
jgi:hypothetical protein